MTVKTRMVIASKQYKKKAVIANGQSATTLDNGRSVWPVAGPILVEAGAADQERRLHCNIISIVILVPVYLS